MEVVDEEAVKTLQREGIARVYFMLPVLLPQEPFEDTTLPAGEGLKGLRGGKYASFVGYRRRVIAVGF